jgi:hypothetical protein
LALARENGFAPACFPQFADAGKELQQIHVRIREECNKYDLTVTPCFSDW